MKSHQSSSRKKGVILLALGLICTQEYQSALGSSLSSKSSIKNRLNQQINSLNLAEISVDDAQATAFIQGLSQEQLLQLQQSQMLSDDQVQEAAAAAPSAEEAAQVQAQETPQAEQQVQAAAQVDEQAQLQAAAQAEALAQAQAQAQVQAQAQLEAQTQAQVAQQTNADAQAELQAQAQAQAEAQAQAQAQAEAEAQAQLQAQAQAQMPTRKPRGRQNIQVAATADVNQAAAVAAAAAALIPDEKPFNKMNAAEKKVYLQKKAQEKAEKAAKEARENPTVDENGEHIQTVAEAKEEAAQLQEMLVAGEQAVDQKIAMEQEQLAAMPATPPPVKQEEDDGHVETVEEVKAKMAAAQAAMDQGLAETDNRVQQMSQEAASMPNFGALADLHGSISNMGHMRKQKQLQDMASKLGVEIQAGEEQLDASELTNTLIERAKQSGKSEAQINAALAE